MSQDKGEEIFLLWKELKRTIDMAHAADLSDVESILRITADTLVQKYYSLGLPTKKDIHSLVWENTEWPATAATYMELKAMLLKAQEVDGQIEKHTPEFPPTSNCA